MLAQSGGQYRRQTRWWGSQWINHNDQEGELPTQFYRGMRPDRSFGGADQNRVSTRFRLQTLLERLNTLL